MNHYAIIYFSILTVMYENLFICPLTIVSVQLNLCFDCVGLLHSAVKDESLGGGA